LKGAREKSGGGGLPESGWKDMREEQFVIPAQAGIQPIAAL